MNSLTDCVRSYRELVQQGDIVLAYKGIQEFLAELRRELMRRHPDWGSPSSVYQGYMDMSYFALMPPALKERRLKLAIVYLHPDMRFDVWLSGMKREVQDTLRPLFQAATWPDYTIPEDGVWVDSIVEYVVEDAPDFDDPGTLTDRIDTGVSAFADDMVSFLDKDAR